jgi:hypothetical protein
LVWFEIPDETRWISIRHCTAKTVTEGKGGNQVPGEDVEKPGTTEKAAEKTVTTNKVAGSARKKPRPPTTEPDEEVEMKAAGAVDGGDEDAEADDTSGEPGSDGGPTSPPRVEQHSAAGNAAEMPPKESAPSAKATPLTRHTVGMMRFRRKKSRKRR